MKTERLKTIGCITATLVLANLVNPAFAQEVSIPDPGLNAAIRDALQQPVGPLTQRALLNLIVLEARGPKCASNILGEVLLTDVVGHLSPRKFYRARSR